MDNQAVFPTLEDGILDDDFFCKILAEGTDVMVQNYQALYEELQAKYTSLQNDFQNIELENYRMSVKYNECHDKCQSLEQECNELNRLSVGYKSDINMFSIKYQDLSAEVSKYKRYCKCAINLEAEAENKQRKKVTVSTQTKIKNSSSAEVMLKNEIHKLNKQLQVSEESHRTEIELSKSKTENLLKRDLQLKSLNESLLNKDLELKSLKEQIIKKDAELMSLTKDVLDKGAKMMSLNNNILKKDSELRTLNEQIHNKEEDLKSMKEVLSLLLNEHGNHGLNISDKLNKTIIESLTNGNNGLTNSQVCELMRPTFKEVIIKKDAELMLLSEKVLIKDSELKALNELLVKTETNLISLNEQMETKDAELRSLNEHILKSDAELKMTKEVLFFLLNKHGNNNEPPGEVVMINKSVAVSGSLESANLSKSIMINPDSQKKVMVNRSETLVADIPDTALLNKCETVISDIQKTAKINESKQITDSSETDILTDNVDNGHLVETLNINKSQTKEPAMLPDSDDNRLMENEKNRTIIPDIQETVILNNSQTMSAEFQETVIENKSETIIPDIQERVILNNSQTINAEFQETVIENKSETIIPDIQDIVILNNSQTMSVEFQETVIENKCETIIPDIQEKVILNNSQTMCAEFQETVMLNNNETMVVIPETDTMIHEPEVSDSELEQIFIEMVFCPLLVSDMESDSDDDGDGARSYVTEHHVIKDLNLSEDSSDDDLLEKNCSMTEIHHKTSSSLDANPSGLSLKNSLCHQNVGTSDGNINSNDINKKQEIVIENLNTDGIKLPNVQNRENCDIVSPNRESLSSSTDLNWSPSGSENCSFNDVLKNREDLESNINLTDKECSHNSSDEKSDCSDLLLDDTKDFKGFEQKHIELNTSSVDAVIDNPPLYDECRICNALLPDNYQTVSTNHLDQQEPCSKTLENSSVGIESQCNNNQLAEVQEIRNETYPSGLSESESSSNLNTKHKIDYESVNQDTGNGLREQPGKENSLHLTTRDTNPMHTKNMQNISQPVHQISNKLPQIINNAISILNPPLIRRKCFVGKSGSTENSNLSSCSDVRNGALSQAKEAFHDKNAVLAKNWVSASKISQIPKMNSNCNVTNERDLKHKSNQNQEVGDKSDMKESIVKQKSSEKDTIKILDVHVLSPPSLLVSPIKENGEQPSLEKLPVQELSPPLLFVSLIKENKEQPFLEKQPVTSSLISPIMSPKFGQGRGANKRKTTNSKKILSFDEVPVNPKQTSTSPSTIDSNIHRPVTRSTTQKITDNQTDLSASKKRASKCMSTEDSTSVKGYKEPLALQETTVEDGEVLNEDTDVDEITMKSNENISVDELSRGTQKNSPNRRSYMNKKPLLLNGKVDQLLEGRLLLNDMCKRKLDDSNTPDNLKTECSNIGKKIRSNGRNSPNNQTQVNIECNDTRQISPTCRQALQANVVPKMHDKTAVGIESGSSADDDYEPSDINNKALGSIDNSGSDNNLLTFGSDSPNSKQVNDEENLIDDNDELINGNPVNLQELSGSSSPQAHFQLDNHTDAASDDDEDIEMPITDAPTHRGLMHKPGNPRGRVRKRLKNVITSGNSSEFRKKHQSVQSRLLKKVANIRRKVHMLHSNKITRDVECAPIDNHRQLNRQSLQNETHKVSTNLQITQAESPKLLNHMTKVSDSNCDLINKPIGNDVSNRKRRSSNLRLQANLPMDDDLPDANGKAPKLCDTPVDNDGPVVVPASPNKGVKQASPIKSSDDSPDAKYSSAQSRVSKKSGDIQKNVKTAHVNNFKRGIECAPLQNYAELSNKELENKVSKILQFRKTDSPKLLNHREESNDNSCDLISKIISNGNLFNHKKPSSNQRVEAKVQMKHHTPGTPEPKVNKEASKVYVDFDAPTEGDMPVVIPINPGASLQARHTRLRAFTKKKAKVLFHKLMNYSKEEKALDEVCNDFMTQDPDFVVKLILDKVSLDIVDRPDDKYAPAPLMTETQRILLGFMTRLEARSGDVIIDRYLKLAEKRLLFNPVLEQIEPITRLYVAICKHRRDINRVRRFCCEAFYFIKEYAVPLVFTVLRSWCEVLPFAADADNFLMGKVLVQSFVQQSRVGRGYNTEALSNLLVKYYGYPIQGWTPAELFKEVLYEYLKNPVRPGDFMVLFFCKSHPSKVVHKLIEDNIKVLFEQTVPDNFKATVIILIGNIVSQFKLDEDQKYVDDIEEWLETIAAGTFSEIIKRSVNMSLSRLPQYNDIS